MTRTFIKKLIPRLLFLALFMGVLSGCNSSQEANILDSEEIPVEGVELINGQVNPDQLMSLWVEGETKDLLEPEIEKKPASITLTNTQKLNEKTYNISGETSANCSKIVVNAYDVFKKSFDVYTLATYKYGDTRFDYGISEAWNNLKVGENTYIFRAYCDEGQVPEAITSISYYGTHEASEVEDNLKAIQEELQTMEELQKKLEILQKENEAKELAKKIAAQNEAAAPNHLFYTSADPTFTAYYCDTDSAWKDINQNQIKSYPNAEALLQDFPSRTLNEPCK